MIIKNVERKEDATTNGAYTCVARNDEGYSARSDLQVCVMGKLKKFITYIAINILIDMGEILKKYILHKLMNFQVILLINLQPSKNTFHVSTHAAPSSTPRSNI